MWTSQSLELWEIYVLFKPPSPWYFVIAAWTDWDKGLPRTVLGHPGPLVEKTDPGSGAGRAQGEPRTSQGPKVKVKSLSRVRFFATPWTVAYQAPPSMGFSRQEYWSGVPFPSPGDLPDPGIEPGFSHTVGRRFYDLSHQESLRVQGNCQKWVMSTGASLTHWLKMGQFKEIRPDSPPGFWRNGTDGLFSVPLLSAARNLGHFL